MARHSDHKYLTALRENDSRLLEELYRECAPGIIRWVTANNGTAADAADLFQEALISLHHSAHKPGYELTCPINALIFTICRNQWINQLRRKKKESEVRIVEAERYIPESATESAYERWEEEQLEKEQLNTSLAQLSATCRDLLRLLGRGVSSAEAAKKLGMTNANTVYRRKNACLQRWRDLFEGMNGLK
ncbi:sigma-70 family RNA polymerase sigma factor [Neolewinella aurantiaca]|uniref:Sigma-70 family RNA polymerase sigma factor n=1 Tax=Neolewinella aurantiaca TaxID=2602767 RepID=A0A5C7FTQ2_9BACT|nr:sigma-70 family RNA polymerase sigma factor [Neolewinella aurantiaca]TXF91481.1 sigma-70 family RNA polymerase sigma factor [Neolewinella aurantiaca]